VIFK